MKKIFFSTSLTIIFLSVCVNAFAMYVVYHKDTKVVYAVSNIDDIVVPEGHEKKKVDGNANEVLSDYEPSDFVVTGSRVQLNMARVNARIAAQNEADRVAREIAEERAKIDTRMREVAYEQLKAEGITFKHITLEELRGRP
jgi:hypothetical protein